jgi:hypothetical protein
MGELSAARFLSKWVPVEYITEIIITDNSIDFQAQFFNNLGNFPPISTAVGN